MALNYVQSNGGNNAASDVKIDAPGIADTAGNFLFVICGKYQAGTTITSVTDTEGNTYVKAGSSQGNDANQTVETWYTPSPIIGSGGNTVTANFSATSQFRHIQVIEFSNTGFNTVAFDNEATLALSGLGTGPYTTNTVTTANSNELVIAGLQQWAGAASVLTATFPATLMFPIASGAAVGSMYLVPTNAGSYTLSATGDQTSQYTLTAKSFNFTNTTPKSLLGQVWT
jgi:hypothetical protein